MPWLIRMYLLLSCVDLVEWVCVDLVLVCVDLVMLVCGCVCVC